MSGLLPAIRTRRERLSSQGVLEFSRQTGLLLLALGVLNGSNYAFHVGVSRPLGPSQYGALAALLAVLMILSVPLGVLQTVVADRAASLRAHGRPDELGAFAARTLRGALPFALAGGAVTLVVAAPFVALFLNVSLTASSILAPYVVVGTLAAIPLGVLQGAMRFGAFAALVLTSVAIRLASGIGLVELGMGVPGAMLASCLAAGATVLLGVRLLELARHVLMSVRGSLAALRGEFRTTLLGMVAFFVLTQADIVLARHYLEPSEAGFYSSAGLLARALLFLPGAVAFVAFPRFVGARERDERAVEWLRISLLAVAALVAGLFPLLILTRQFLVDVAFGPSFAPASDLIPVLCLAMAAQAVIGLLTLFHIAMGSRAYVLSLAGVLAEAALIAGFHENARQVAVVVTGVSAVVALGQYAAAHSLSKWRPGLLRIRDPNVEKMLADPPSVEVSVVVPCHNAGRGLQALLVDLVDELELADSYEVIVVSDGSTDETVRIAEEFRSDGLRVVHYPERAGKGYALQVGLTEARGRYVAFVDGDGDIGPEAIGPFLAIMKLYEPDIVLGSKRHPLSDVYYPPLRRLMSWTYHKVTRLLFRVNVRDTQTGMKLVRRDVLAAVLPRLFEKRYAFDLELLVVARTLGYRRIFEAPIRIDYRFSSHVRAGSVLRILIDTAAIFYRHYILGSYRGGAGRLAGAAQIAALEKSVMSRNGTRRNGRKRFLFLNWRDIANPEAGGAEVVTHEVAKRWVEWGHEVTVLTSRFRGSSSSEVVDGVHIRRLGNLRNGSYHLLVQRELARLRGFDAIIDEINTAPFLTPLWRRRLPRIVALVHQLAGDVLDAELPRPLARLGRWLEPRALRLYRDVPVVTVSDSTKEDLRRIGLDHVSVIPDGRDDPPALEGVTKEERPTLLFVGRLAANKRPHHAVEAFRHVRRVLPDARLWIVGQGPLANRLALDLPDGAEMLGFLPRHELYERMTRAHVLLVPSVREGWGLVVIEANSVGTPAVAYDVPGLRDSVRDGITGRLAAAGEPASLARHAVELLSRPEEYAVMSQRARDWAELFSWNETARRLLEVVDQSTPSAV